LPIRPREAAAQLPWVEVVERVRAALAQLPHSEVRDRVLEQLRRHGHTLPDCQHHPEARVALAISLTSAEDDLEMCRPKWDDRSMLRDIRRRLEWKLWA